eukprot:GAHX01002583.1.p1 GENE.GAHX01002583.1~~GAHX01002583.1.p1  ORF type:complete len:233 (+),score=31.63 GAHX01002583.1:174-872(+)
MQQHNTNELIPVWNTNFNIDLYRHIFADYHYPSSFKLPGLKFEARIGSFGSTTTGLFCTSLNQITFKALLERYTMFNSTEYTYSCQSKTDFRRGASCYTSSSVSTTKKSKKKRKQMDKVTPLGYNDLRFAVSEIDNLYSPYTAYQLNSISKYTRKKEQHLFKNKNEEFEVKFTTIKLYEDRVFTQTSYELEVELLNNDNFKGLLRDNVNEFIKLLDRYLAEINRILVFSKNI